MKINTEFVENRMKTLNMTKTDVARKVFFRDTPTPVTEMLKSGKVRFTTIKGICETFGFSPDKFVVMPEIPPMTVNPEYSTKIDRNKLLTLIAERFDDLDEAAHGIGVSRSTLNKMFSLGRCRCSVYEMHIVFLVRFLLSLCRSSSIAASSQRRGHGGIPVVFPPSL